MKHIKSIILISLAFSVFFIGCSSSLSDTLFKPVTHIPTNKSVIYLYRPNDDKSTKFTITYNNKEICVLENGGYFPLFVNEGKVEIFSTANFKLLVTPLFVGSTDIVLKAEHGKYYYVLCQDDGFSGSKLSMKVVPENFGVNSIKECRLLEPISQ